MDKHGNIENKETFSRSEVDLIISRVRYKTLKELNEAVEKEGAQAKDASFESVKDEGNALKKAKATQHIHTLNVLTNLESNIRNKVVVDIKNYLTD
ncbi:MAG: hypothetical protein AABY15_02605 [Nanoarchaeota archaeon]|mgnify:CR=1 FL=1